MPQTPTTPITPAIRSRTPLAIAAAAGLAMLTPLAHAQATIEWASPVDGDFGVAPNWFPAVVPGALDTARLSGIGTYVVDINAPRTIAALDITQLEIIAAVAGGASLALDRYEGAGTLLINRTASDSTALLRVPDAAVIDADVRLNSRPGDAATAQINRIGAGDAPTFGPNSTISGRGRIIGAYTNQGVIETDALIRTFNTTITQDGGIVRGVDGGEFGLFQESIVTGGTWEALGTGGLVTSDRRGSIIDATMAGDWGLPNGGQVNFGGAITGDGVVTVNTTAGDITSEFRTLDGAMIDIDVVLNSRAGDTATAQIVRPGAGDTPTFGPNSTIRGRGRLAGAFIAQGTIETDDLIQTFNTNITQDGGIMRGVDGGEFGLFQESLVTGGTWEALGTGGLVNSDRRGTIVDAIMNGPWGLPAGGQVNFGGTVTGDGVVTVNTIAGDITSEFRVLDGATIGIDVVLNSRPGDTATAQIVRPGAGDTPTFGPGTTISGRGRLAGAFVAQGAIETDDLIQTFGSNITQDGGVMRGIDGGTFGIFQETQITGGTWHGVGTGGLVTSDRRGTILDAAMNGPWGLPNGGQVNFGGVIDGDASMLVNTEAGDAVSEFRVLDGATISIDVTLNSRPGDTATAQIVRPGAGDTPTFGPECTISGRGRIEGEYRIEGTLAPGVGDGVNVIESFGRAALTFGPTARTEIDAAGTGLDQFDRFATRSPITIDGALDVDFVDGYIPEPLDQFEVITGSAVDGFFADIDIEPVGAIGPAHIVYTGDSVIVVICAADRDADGELTIFDFLAFQNLFDAGDLRADLDEDGRLTIFDFLVFQNRFDAGCG